MRLNYLTHRAINNVLSVFLLLLLPPVFIVQQFLIASNRFSVTLRKSDAILIVTVAVLSMIFYVGGHKNISGVGISAFYGFYLVALAVASCLLINSIRKSSLQFVFNDIVFWYIALSFFYSLLLYPEVRPYRELVLLFQSKPGNSTNFINLIVLCCVLLYVSEKRKLILYLMLTLALSALWQNRTGMILASSLMIMSLMGSKPRLRLLLLAIGGSYVMFKADLSAFLPARLADEGLESARWLMQLEALQSIISFEHFLGGFTPSSDISPWLHNAILDIYRVTGLLPALGMLGLILYAGWRNIMSASTRFRRGIAWGMGTAVAMTSVVFEGHILEFIYFLLIVFNFYFLPCKRPSVLNV